MERDELIEQCVTLTLRHDPLNRDALPQDLADYYYDIVTERHLVCVEQDHRVIALAETFWLDDETEIPLIELGVWPPATKTQGALYYVHNALAVDRAALWQLWRQRPPGPYRLRWNRQTGRRPHVLDRARTW